MQYNVSQCLQNSVRFVAACAARPSVALHSRNSRKKAIVGASHMQGNMRIEGGERDEQKR